MNRSFSYIVTTFNAIHTRVGKIIIPLEKFPEMEISSSSFLHVAERRTLNVECRAANDPEVLWLELGNRVNEVLGQFSWYNDSKWNLIY